FDSVASSSRAPPPTSTGRLRTWASKVLRRCLRFLPCLRFPRFNPSVVDLPRSSSGRVTMQARRLSCTLLLMATAASAQPAATPDLEGLWVAHARYGPDLRGRLMIFPR